MSDTRITSLLIDYLKRAMAGTLPGGTLTVGSPNKIGQGVKTISQNNTAEVLSDISVSVRSVLLQSPKTNSNIYVGDSSVDNTSFKLEKDTELGIDISDLRNIYVYGTAGNKVYYIYTYTE